MNKSEGKKTQVIGLTGEPCCGKTTIAGLFKRRGAYIIDADQVYHRLIRPGQALYKRLIAKFGQAILFKGRIDRKKLGALAFANPRQLKALTRLTHPVILACLQKELQAARGLGKSLVVIDAPLLIETGLHKKVDIVIVVKTSRLRLIQRCRKLRGLKRAVITNRIKSQLPLNNKIRLADYVIENNGTIADTNKQVRELLGALAHKRN
ncbi:MAG: dephospho-CoA kinase [Candidatus Omnitrophota bacterium]